MQESNEKELHVIENTGLDDGMVSDLDNEVPTDEATIVVDNCIAVETDLSGDLIERDVAKHQYEIEELKRENETLKQASKQLL